MISAAAVLLAFSTSASAHTIFQELHVNGVSAGHTTGIRVPEYDGPITDVTSNGSYQLSIGEHLRWTDSTPLDVICNGGINPYRQPVSTEVIPVPAGASVTAEWHHTLEGAKPGDASDPIDASHKGPVISYLAKIPDATQQDVSGLKWFKIHEDGYDASSSKWGVDRMIDNKGKVTFSIPECVAPGQYLLRHELIALHSAGSYPGAQLYMECAQIEITGSGSASPATVSFPGAYSGSHPGITFNLYQPFTNYTIPGPAVFTC